MVSVNLTVPIKVELPEDWIEQVINRLRNDPDSEWIEVIRCKDCKQFRRWIDTDICFCDITESEISDNDFCSRSERREDG